jgi:hypothetical protein
VWCNYLGWLARYGREICSYNINRILLYKVKLENTGLREQLQLQKFAMDFLLLNPLFFLLNPLSICKRCIHAACLELFALLCFFTHHNYAWEMAWSTLILYSIYSTAVGTRVSRTRECSQHELRPIQRFLKRRLIMLKVMRDKKVFPFLLFYSLSSNIKNARIDGWFAFYHCYFGFKQKRYINLNTNDSNKFQHWFMEFDPRKLKKTLRGQIGSLLWNVKTINKYWQLEDW